MTKGPPNGDQGAAAVEMALVLPILILLIGGIIDFGLALNGQISLTHAAREGVRYEALETGDAEAEGAAAFAAINMGAPAPDLVADCDSGPQARLVLEASYEPFFLLPMFNSPLEGQAVMRCGG